MSDSQKKTLRYVLQGAVALAGVIVGVIVWTKFSGFVGVVLGAIIVGTAVFDYLDQLPSIGESLKPGDVTTKRTMIEVSIGADHMAPTAAQVSGLQALMLAANGIADPANPTDDEVTALKALLPAAQVPSLHVQTHASNSVLPNEVLEKDTEVNIPGYVFERVKSWLPAGAAIVLFISMLMLWPTGDRPLTADQQRMVDEAAAFRAAGKANTPPAVITDKSPVTSDAVPQIKDEVFKLVVLSADGKKLTVPKVDGYRWAAVHSKTPPVGKYVDLKSSAPGHVVTDEGSTLALTTPETMTSVRVYLVPNGEGKTSDHKDVNPTK